MTTTGNVSELITRVTLMLAAICCAVNLRASIVLLACACIIQQLRILAIKERACDAENEANVYKAFIQKQLRKYKEGIFNDKRITKDNETI